jgi:hypothetical protein
MRRSPLLSQPIAGAAVLTVLLAWPAHTGRAETAPDYSAFRVIAERNIFDPNRTPEHPSAASATPPPRAVPPPPPSAAIALVGTMSYEKGTFAFFDGTLADYRKVLKLRGTIAGYSVAAIGPDMVILTADKESLTLKVGQQLRCEGGEWRVADAAALPAVVAGSAGGSPGAYSPGQPPPAAGTDPGTFSPDANDVLRRLMQRREQELK